MKDYAITCYSPSTFTSVCLAIVSAESYGDAWRRYVRKHGPQRNESSMGVVTARDEHYASGVARID